MNQPKPPVRNFLLWIAPAILIGILLRCYQITDQIIINDEWHGLNYVIGKSFMFVATHHGLGANSIPMNLYRWLLLNTVGWSELLLRLPLLLSGLLALMVLPVLARCIVNLRTAVIFAYLLAISPSLVFYSRLSRPYGLVVFLGGLALFCLLIWLDKPGFGYATVFVLSAVLAVYLHLYAAITVFVPLMAAAAWKLVMVMMNNQGLGKIRIQPGLPSLMGAGCVSLLLLALLLLPAHLRNAWWMNVLGDHHVNPDTMVGLLTLLSGTTNGLMNLIFYGLLGVGTILILNNRRFVGIVFILITAVYMLMIGLSRQEGIFASIQVARYCIALFPMALLMVAYGVDRILDILKPRLYGKRLGIILYFLIPAALLINLLTLGPLPVIYGYRNSFSNHFAFQGSYRAHDWDRSKPQAINPGYQMSRNDIPPFYDRLAAEPGNFSIVEFPMLMGDTFNLFYYYQQVHGKPIITGYLDRTRYPHRINEDFVYGIEPAGSVMGRLGASDKHNFTNLINIMDIEKIGSGRVKYIIIHKNIIAEMAPYFAAGRGGPDATAARVAEWYRANCKPPVYTDSKILVFENQCRVP